MGNQARAGATMGTAPISARQFALLRMVLGACMSAYFVGLAAELAERSGSLASGAFSSYDGVIRSAEMPLGAGHQLEVAVGFLLLGFVGSIALALGWRRRLISALLLVLWSCVVGAQGWAPLGAWGSVAFVLIWMLCAPRGEPLALSKGCNDWALGHGFHRVALFGLLAATSALGCKNAVTLSDSGAAMVVTWWGVEAVDASVGALAWGVIVIQLCALPIGLWARFRRWMWVLLTAMQCMALIVCESSWPHSAVLLLHLLSLDARWLPPLSLGRQPSVVYFDGVCNLCNGAVDFILAEDRAEQFRFAPIQGQMAAKLQVKEVKQGRSLALYADGQLSLRTDAICAIAAGLGGHWRLLSYARYIPRPLRDALYEVIQRNRYRWFGTSPHCRVPTAAQRERFFD